MTKNFFVIELLVILFVKTHTVTYTGHFLHTLFTPARLSLWPRIPPQLSLCLSSFSLITIRIKYISIILIKVYSSRILGKAWNPKPAQPKASIPSETLPPKSHRPAILSSTLFLFPCSLCSFLSYTDRNNRPRFLKIFYRTEMYRPTMLNFQTKLNAEVAKMQHETSHSSLYNIALCSIS